MTGAEAQAYIDGLVVERAERRRVAARKRSREYASKKRQRDRKAYNAQALAASVEQNATLEGTFRSLCRQHGVDRNLLTVPALVEKFHTQNGLCAISGVPMTWGRGRGIVPTNVSIDRIVPGGPYSIENVQLVCRFINHAKWMFPQEELIRWCTLVAEKHRADK